MASEPWEIPEEEALFKATPLDDRLDGELLKNRIIVINGEIREDLVNSVCRRLIFLGTRRSKKPIRIILNSVGGEVFLGLLIFNTIKALVREGHQVHIETRGLAACYDDKAEILTEAGWKLFKDLKKRDKVATLNKEGFLVYQKPNRIFKYDYKGEMINFRGRFLDLLVTPNHNMYISKETHKPPFFKEWSLEKATNLLRGRFKTKRNFRWEGQEKDLYFLPPPERPFHRQRILEAVRIKDYLRLLGWYLSEGSTKRRTVILSNRDQRLKEEMAEVIKKLGIHPWIGWDRVTLCSKQLADEFRKLGPSHQKFIPREFKNLSPRLLRILLDSLLDGDGDKRRRTYYTSSKQLAEDVHEIALKAGYSAIISKRERLTRPIIRGRKIYPRFPQYQVLLSRKMHEPVSYLKPTVEEYEGKVYCVEVPNHIIYVKRNGRSLWSGNSMGSYILQAGSKRIASKYSRFLIHEITSFTFGRSCLPLSTEFLTKEGWKTIDNYRGEEVAVFNPLGREISWERPSKIIFSPTDKVLTLKTRKFDMKVTDEHRIFGYDKCGKCKEDFRFVKPKRNTDLKVRVSLDSFKGEGLKISEDLLRLLAWVSSEGCYHKTNGIIEIYQTNKYPEYLETIERLLVSSKIPFKKDEKNSLSRFNCFRFRIPRRETSTIRKYLPTKDDLSELLKLSSRQSKIFIDEYAKGDGSKQGRWINISAKGKKKIDQLQILALKAGYSAIVGRTRKGKDYWHLWLSPTKDISLGKVRIETEKRNQLVWCFKVSSGAFLVRENNKPFITGNSEVKEQAEETIKTNNMLREILVERTGKTAEEIEKLWHKKDVWMSAEEALNFGLVDEIV